jgi:hypothetical protein
LFDAPDCETWSRLERETFTPALPMELADVVRSLYDPLLALSLSSTWGMVLDEYAVEAVVVGAYTHIRCRSIAMLKRPDPPEVYDRDSAAALQRWLGTFSCRGSTSMLSWHGLNIGLLIDQDLRDKAGGRHGVSSANHAMGRLEKTWFNTPAARRCLLHAGQIVSLCLSPMPNGLLSLTFHQVSVPFKAALVIFVYAILLARSSNSNRDHLLSASPPVNIDDGDVDWSHIGMLGFEPGRSDSPRILAPHAAFILRG